MLVSDFDFHLPADLIAQRPAPRGESRLLVMDRATGDLRHLSISDLPDVLRPDDLLIVNDTQVFAARLLGHRVPSGGRVECLLLGAPLDVDREGHAVYEALLHPGQKLKPGARMRFDGAAGELAGEILEQRFHGRRRIRLWAEGGGDIETVIDAIGHMPLPPYIDRSDEADDRDRYQTVYARTRGSVAAPTAGLHFSLGILERCRRRGIAIASVTLHVGYGTFKPVRATLVEDHEVDPEPYEIGETTADAIGRARTEGRRIMVVGTTTTRALEDAAARGQGVVHAGRSAATLFIHPGHRFQVIDGLVTNFHLPRSSLLMLVSAFAGREAVLAAYAEAVRQRYRFYSYGDAMLMV